MSSHQIDLGDRGQRYEVRGHAVEGDKTEIIGWTDDLGRAQKLVESIEKWPRYDRGWFIDRKPEG